MAKTQTSKGINSSKNVPQREQYARMSFLFQASSSLITKNKSFLPLANIYCQTMKSVSRKNVLRISPHIKRQVCKSCSQILIPGITCSVRLVNDSKSKDEVNDILQISCHCGTPKNFPVGKDPDYQLWCDKPDREE